MEELFIEFINLCYESDLEGAKRILKKYPYINVSYDNELAFCNVCYYGHLDIAKWLLSVKPDINISINNEKAFRSACFKGHLEVAKWLLSVKPDINISIKNEKAFRYACFEGHLEVAKWLQTLKPYLYVIEYDIDGKYTGYKIRSKKESNWKKRKYALHLTFQEKTNILYHLPVDIAKMVTLFV